mmetsp:Transcript_21810/g.74129  ORF Transcript_21810/g.74129 Transcript_21810/m.74129 type:complete len:227 (-) Transcript_21810:391-1071(-)
MAPARTTTTATRAASASGARGSPSATPAARASREGAAGCSRPPSPARVAHASVARTRPAGRSALAAPASCSGPTRPTCGAHGGAPSCTSPGLNSGESATHLPTMTSVGLLSPAPRTAPARSPRLENALLCSGVVPRSTATAGVAGSRPARSIESHSDGSVPRPMYTTSVVSASAAENAKPNGSCPPSCAWPVRNRTELATPRWVSGTPSSAAIPAALVMPGTTPTS